MRYTCCCALQLLLSLVPGSQQQPKQQKHQKQKQQQKQHIGRRGRGRAQELASGRETVYLTISRLTLRYVAHTSAIAVV